MSKVFSAKTSVKTSALREAKVRALATAKPIKGSWVKKDSSVGTYTSEAPVVRRGKIIGKQ